MKIKIKVTINDKKCIYDALKIDNKIIYNDEDYSVIIDLNNNTLKRRNLDYDINLKFIKNEKTNGYLNINNHQFSLEIFTNELTISDNLVLIDYKIITTLESVLYKVEVIYE